MPEVSTQITGGKVKGHKIRAGHGSGLRPTTQKVRASIYSILGKDSVEGLRVLDLYAGTGVLGIEALSRGALYADFVESHYGRCRNLRGTLKMLNLTSISQVHNSKVEKVLNNLSGNYGLVLIDPPYEKDQWSVVMNMLNEHGLVNQSGNVVTEHHYTQQMAVRYGKFVLTKTKRYGDTSISVYNVENANG